MSSSGSSSAKWVIVAVLVLAVGVGVLRAVSSGRGSLDPLRPPEPSEVDALAGTTDDSSGAAAERLPVLPVADSAFGRSGALRFRTLTRAEAAELPGFIEQFGEEAIRKPAVHRVSIAGRGSTFAYIVLRAFGEKRGEHLGDYRLGRWPSERWMMARNYWNPDGFIEVTPENAKLQLSTHFTLGEFVTHDQREVWPKYVVLEEAMIDKLELVLADLTARGIPTQRVRVLSGFRAPYYNDRITGEGAARASRHQYGDAADIIVDADGDGRMDDLNRDGRLDLRDTELILRAIERVERQYPDLLGGTGLYHAIGPSGPFAHVDVRGTSARWTNAPPPAERTAAPRDTSTR